MIGHRGVPICARVEPNLVTARGLAIEFEAARFEFSHDLAIAKACETAHLRCNDDCEILPISSRRQIGKAVALPPRFDQFAGDIARNVECFSNRAPLCNKARQFIGRGEKQTLWQLLDMYANGQLHTRDGSSSLSLDVQVASIFYLAARAKIGPSTARNRTYAAASGPRCASSGAPKPAITIENSPRATSASPARLRPTVSIPARAAAQ
jgi:hypothetical protein